MTINTNPVNTTDIQLHPVLVSSKHSYIVDYHIYINVVFGISIKASIEVTSEYSSIVDFTDEFKQNKCDVSVKTSTEYSIEVSSEYISIKVSIEVSSELL